MACPDGNGHLDERKVEVKKCGSDREILMLSTPECHSDKVISETPGPTGAPIDAESEVCIEAKREIHIKKT